MEVETIKTCELYQFLISVVILAPIAQNGKSPCAGVLAIIRLLRCVSGFHETATAHQTRAMMSRCFGLLQA